MILEAIVTTLDASGTLNVAPMGPDVAGGMSCFVLRPFRTTTTYRNLVETGEGVVHVTDDVLLLARAAIGRPVSPATRAADVVRGRILIDACRYYEFRVTHADDRQERATFWVETVAEGRQRDVFGFNRAKHAVVEAAILATRIAFLPLEAILADFEKLEVIVGKTGGPQELDAFALLSGFVQDEARRRGIVPDGAVP